MRTVRWLAWLLLVVSAYPIAWQLAEVVASRRMYARYAANTLAAQRIQRTDRAIVVDGRPIARLPGAQSFAVIELRDRISGTSVPVVIEWRGGSDRSTWRYRTVTIHDAGRVTIDEFTEEQRASSPLRTVLARFVSPTGIGFYFDVLELWPTALYPILYPWLTAVISSLVLLIIWKRRAFARRFHQFHQ